LPKIFKASNVIVDKNTVNIRSEIIDKYSSKNSLDDPEAHERMQREAESKILDRAVQEAKDVVKKAHDDVEVYKRDRLKEIQSEIDDLMEQSKEEGYETGYNEAITEKEKIIKEANGIKEDAISYRKELLDNLEPEIIGLVSSVLGKLLSKSVEVHDDIILYLIKQGLDETSTNSDINIRVSKEDYDFVIRNKDKIFSMNENSSDIEIIKDLALKKSDCVLETAFGNIDSSLDEQFKLLKESLYYILDERESDTEEER